MHEDHRDQSEQEERRMEQEVPERGPGHEDFELLEEEHLAGAVAAIGPHGARPAPEPSPIVDLIVDQSTLDADLIADANLIEGVSPRLLIRDEVAVRHLRTVETDALGIAVIAGPRATVKGDLAEILRQEAVPPDDTEVFGVDRGAVVVDVGDALDVVVAHDQAPELVFGHRLNSNRMAFVGYFERLALGSRLTRLVHEGGIDLGGVRKGAFVPPGQDQHRDEGKSDETEDPSTTVEGLRHCRLRRGWHGWLQSERHLEVFLERPRAPQRHGGA